MIRTVEENREATRNLFEKGGRFCINNYDHANTKPVIFAERDIVLLLSGRAGSTFALKWYLHQNAMESEYAWTHSHRMKVIYPAAWHEERREAIYRGDPFTMVRFVRNPFSRAVSSYLHSTQNEPVYRNIVNWQGHADGYSFVDFLTYLDEIGVQRVNSHFAHQFNYLEHLHELDAFCRIESGIDGLHEFEAKLGLPHTPPEVYAALKSSPHNLAYDEAGDDASTRTFTLGRRVPYPSPDRFYNDHTVALVRRVYAKDFERLGYSQDLPDLRPRNRTQGS